MFNPRIQRLERVLEGVAKVPAPSASEKDKVPTVNSDGDYVLEDIPKEVPVPAVADSGKAIVVGSDGKYKLDNIPNEVPVPAVADSGKAIVVGSNGAYKLDNVGGGSILEETGEWTSNGVSEPSVTFAQASDAFDKGSPILCSNIADFTSAMFDKILLFPTGKVRTFMYPSGNKTNLVFTAITDYDATVTIFSIVYGSDGSVNCVMDGIEKS